MTRRKPVRLMLTRAASTHRRRIALGVAALLAVFVTFAASATVQPTGVSVWEGSHIGPHPYPQTTGPWGDPRAVCTSMLGPNFTHMAPRPGYPGDFHCFCTSNPPDDHCTTAFGNCPLGRTAYNPALCHPHLPPQLVTTPYPICRPDYANPNDLCPFGGEDPPKNAGPPPDCRGNPINVATGNKYEEEVDIAAVDGLEFRRYYNSDRYPRPRQMFAAGWRGTYDRSVIYAPTPGPLQTAVVYRHDGRGYYFNFNSVTSAWVSDSDVKLKLQQTTSGAQPSGWIVTGEDDTTETYDVAGNLVSVTRHGVLVAEIAYVNDRVSTVTASTGRQLTFAYSPTTGQLQSITSPLGVQVSYTYDSGGQLEYAQYPDGTSRRYHYEKSGSLYSTLLTGISTLSAAGEVRSASWDYDANGRATLSVHGPTTSYRDRVEVDYATPTASQRVVRRFTTGSAYTTETVTVTTTIGVSRVTTSDTPCASCGGSLVTSRTFDANGFLNLETDARGSVTDYDFNARGLEESKIEASNATCSPAPCVTAKRTIATQWDSSFRMPLSITRANDLGTIEAKTLFSLNARGDVVARCEQAPSQSAACSPTGAPASDQRRTVTVYCEAVNLADPDPIGAGENLGKGCPLIGRVRRIDGPRTDVNDWTTFEYRLADDSTCASGGACTYRKGDLWKAINAAGHVTEYVTYDKAGRATRVKDANGVITDLVHHARGWLSQRIVRANADGTPSSLDATTTLTYDASGNVKRVTQPDDSYVDYTYDPADRLTDITDSLGNTIHYTLNEAGDRTKEETKTPAGVVKRILARQFDTLSRMKSLVNAPYANQSNLDDPSVKKTRFTYDANGNTESVTDPLDTETENEYDPLNRLTRTIQDVGGIGAEVEYEYDARDNLVVVNDPKDLDTTYGYDGLNNLLQLVSPDTGTTTYTYDAAGNRATQTDARGVTSTYAYDALNRLTSIAYPTTALNVGFEYDEAHAGCEPANGRLTRMTDASGETTFCYDKRGNLVKKVQTTGSATFTTEWTYDLADRVDTVLYPSGALLQYARDDGRITAITVLDSASGPFDLITGVEYRPFGPVSAITFANGRTMAREYDQNYWIESITTPADSVSVSFEPDDLGNIVDIATSGASSVARHYAYDDLSRLTDVTPGTGSPIESFTYDATGNRLSKAVGGPATTYTYPATNHRLTAVGSAGRSYDPNGNYTATGPMGPLEAVYDNRNRLAKWRSGISYFAHYQYNARGERVSKLLPGVDHRAFVYDESGRLLGEYDAGDVKNTINEIVWLDDLPVAVLRKGAHYYIEADHLGTPRAIIDVERSNTPVWRWDLAGPTAGSSAVFGDALPDTDPDGDSVDFEFNLRFPGQYYDAETGLHYNYFRDYEPTTGRYIESDPVGLAGDVSTYAYVASAPLELVDELGLAATIPDPNGIVPGGPWSPAGPGQRPGTFYGPPNPFGGPRDTCTYVPPRGDDAPYWKRKVAGSKGWERYSTAGRPITPEQAHPGRPRDQSPLPPWLARAFVTIFLATYSKPAH